VDTFRSCRVSRPRLPRLILPAHVHLVRANGREYFYFQRFRGTFRAAARVRLPGCPTNPDGTPNTEWWAAYRACAGEPEPAVRAGSFAALSSAYRASPEWAQLANSTRHDYARYLKVIESAWGNLDVRGVEPKHIISLRDRFADVPPADQDLRTRPLGDYLDRKAAANGLIRSLSAMLAWGIPRGWRRDNPAVHVPKLQGGDPYPAWPMRAIEYYRKHARPHLWWVAAHALYTGQRQGDVLKMRRNHVADGAVRVKQQKTGKYVWIPLHQDLREIQANMPVVSTHLLTTLDGTPWSKDGFKSSWNKEMHRRIFSPLKKNQLVFHGLRKSAVVFLLEAGCTTAEVQAITGQTIEMVEHYAKQVSQEKLARSAILKWEGAGGQKKND
jgi:integrase